MDGTIFLIGGIFLALFIAAMAIERFNHRNSAAVATEAAVAVSAELKPGPVLEARIVETHDVSRAAIIICAFALLATCGMALLKYWIAADALDQIVALCLWIGGTVFWGGAIVVLRGPRTYLVYRQPDRQ